MPTRPTTHWHPLRPDHPRTLPHAIASLVLPVASSGAVPRASPLHRRPRRTRSPAPVILPAQGLAPPCAPTDSVFLQTIGHTGPNNGMEYLTLPAPAGTDLHSHTSLRPHLIHITAETPAQARTARTDQSRTRTGRRPGPGPDGSRALPEHVTHHGSRSRLLTHPVLPLAPRPGALASPSHVRTGQDRCWSSSRSRSEASTSHVVTSTRPALTPGRVQSWSKASRSYFTRA